MMQIMTMEDCRKWLRSLMGAPDKNRPQSLTIAMIANMTGIPLNSLKWIVHTETGRCGADRLRQLSKIRAEWEAGTLAFRREGVKKVQYRPDKPRPNFRYQVQMVAGAPKLKTADRLRPSSSMPTLSKLLGKT